MIKSTIVLINFIGLFFLHFFTANNITIENIAPDNMPPGAPTLVEVMITKNEVQGFAKMEIVLPEGFVATPGETKGASFTFSDKKVRLVWMTLPTEPSFKVTYYLECPESMTGKYEARGSFSYINNNERIDYVIPTEHIFVSKDAAVAQQSEAPSTNEVVQSNPLAAEEKKDLEASPSINPENGSRSSDNISSSSENNPNTMSDQKAPQEVKSDKAANMEGIVCERRFTRISDNEFRVDVRIVNSNISGFAKVVENGPALSKTEKIQDAGATVTADKNSIKFVWFEIPKAPIIEFSYKLTTLSASTSNPEVTGKLAFVENNNPKELGIINAGSSDVSSPVLVENTKKIEGEKQVAPSTTTNSTATKKEVEKDKEEVVATTSNKETQKEKQISPPSSVTTKSKKTVVDVPSAENGVSYKVQILAAHRVVNKTYFKQRHGFGEEFNIENHEGWVKYTTGKFGEYKNARDERERLKSSYNTLPGPFVTAYNNGERITVQEALLITKQQWYQ